MDQASAWPARMVAVVILAAAIALSPRIPLPIPIPGRAFELRLDDVVILVLLSLGIWRLRRGGEVYVSGLFPPVAIFLGYALSLTLIVQAIDPVSPARAFFYSLKEVEYFLIFLIVANGVRTERDLARIVSAMLLLGAVNLLWGGLVMVEGDGVSLARLVDEHLAGMAEDRFTRYGITTAGEMSAFSVCLYYTLIAFLALGLFAHFGNKKYLLLYLAASLGAFLSGEKIAVVLFIVGLGMLSGLNRGSLKRLTWVLLALPVLIVTFNMVSDTVTSRFGGLQRIFHTHAYALHEDRLGRWQSAAEWLKEHPVQGIGKGGEFFIPGEDGALEEFHNYYVKTAVETGLPGLVLFLWMLGAISWRLFQGYSNSRHGLSRAINFVALAALVGISISALVQDAFKAVLPNTMLWFLLGLAAATWKWQGNSCDNLLSEENNNSNCDVTEIGKNKAVDNT